MKKVLLLLNVLSVLGLVVGGVILTGWCFRFIFWNVWITLCR